MRPIPESVIRQQLAFYGIKPYPEQWPILMCNRDVIGIFGGEGASKSWLASVFALLRLPFGKLFWVVGPDYEQARKELKYLDAWIGVKGGTKQANQPQSGGSWSLLTSMGQLIQTKSADDPTKISSEPVDGIIISEAAQTNRDIFERCCGRVNRNKGGGWILTTGTYEEGHPWYEEFHDQLEKEGAAFTLPSWVNRADFPGGYDLSCKHFNDQGEKVCGCDWKLINMLIRYGERRFKKRVAGIIVPTEELVYDCFHSQLVVPLPCAPDEFSTVIAGVDWGFGDPTAIEVFGLFGGVWYGLDEFYADHYTAPKLKEIFHALADKDRVSCFYAPHDKPEKRSECSGPGVVIHGIGRPDIMEGVGWCYSLMETGRLKFCGKEVGNVHTAYQPKLLNEFKFYAYPSRESRKRGEKPLGVNDHASDSMKTAMLGIRRSYEAELARRPLRDFRVMRPEERVRMLKDFGPCLSVSDSKTARMW